MVCRWRIRILGIVRFEKTNRRHKEETVGADPDVESGFKELIMLRGLYHTLENALRTVITEVTYLPHLKYIVDLKYIL